MQQLFAQRGATSARSICRDMAWVVQLPTGQSVTAAVERYATSNLVAKAEPDMLEEYFDVPRIAARERAHVVPNDPLWSQLWGLDKIGVSDAWDFQKGDLSVVLAIIDSGTDYTHPDLAGREWMNPGEIAGDGIDNDANGYVDDVRGWDFLDSDNDPSQVDASGYPEAHGTHVAGTVGATVDNALGVAGVSWNCQLMLLRIGNAMGLPRSASFEAITYAGDNGADALNMSYGGFYSSTYDTPVGYAYSKGVVLCAAAGNSDWEFTTDPNTWMSPVCNDGVAGVDNKVVGVAASDQDDLRAVFSNYSGVDKLVDVSAPGVEILSTVPGGLYESWDGTSMACPHVVGLAGLVVSQLGKDTPDVVINQLRDTTVNIDGLNPLYAGKLGTGRIDATSAVGYDAPPEPATAVNAFDTANDEGGSITVTWRRSKDDNAGRNDVIGYELWRGTQPDPQTAIFTRIADRTALPPRSSGYIDSSVTDGLPYYYFVRTLDASNQVDSTVAGPASSRDDAAPPVVDELVAQDTQADNGRSITLSWVGYPGAADITKFYVYRSESEFVDVTEGGVAQLAEIANPLARNYVDKAQDPNADPAEPEAQPLDQTDYWYAVTALDEANNEIKAVTAVGPAQCAPNLSITFSYGMRMITVPAEPIDPSPMAVFGLSDPAAADFARYDPLTQSYRVLAQTPDDPFLRIVPGRAFWLNRNIPSFIGVGGRLVDDPESEVALDQGWNQVGSPYDADYLFEGITVKDPFGTDLPITASNAVRKYGWRYDAFQRGYRLISPLLPNADTSLPKREGMWLYAEAPGVTLVFQNNVGVAGEATAAKPAKIDGWQIQLIARTANAADTDNFLGVTSQAQAIGPILGPPAASGGVDLFFTARGTDRLAADLRKTAGAQAKWNVVVECGAAADTPVELTWPDLSPLPNEVRPILKDLATGRSLYMRTAKGYTYISRAAGEQRKFAIVSAAPDAGPVISRLAAAPTRAGGVELTYVLNRAPAGVKVDVLNVAGRVVATVATPQGQVGLNRVLWNGQAPGGQAVPNGRYVIRVTAVTEDNGETASALAAVTLQR